jgi:hypothetical protein
MLNALAKIHHLPLVASMVNPH